MIHISLQWSSLYRVPCGAGYFFCLKIKRLSLRHPCFSLGDIPCMALTPFIAASSCFLQSFFPGMTGSLHLQQRPSEKSVFTRLASSRASPLRFLRRAHSKQCVLPFTAFFPQYMQRPHVLFKVLTSCFRRRVSCRFSSSSAAQYLLMRAACFAAHSAQSVLCGSASSLPHLVQIPCALRQWYVSRAYTRLYSRVPIDHHPTASTAASMVGQYRSISSAVSPRRQSASQKISISSCMRVVSVIRLPPRTAPRFRRTSTS